MTKKTLKVLLADDIQLELEMEKTFFQRTGFQVLTAKDGYDAIAQAMAERPQLIILDQVMPGLSGSEVCRQLKARTETQGIPVIITSVLDTLEVRDACRDAGAAAFVAKYEGRDALLHNMAVILGIPERRATRLTVFFLVQEIVGAKESIGKGVDLSEGGMRLETGRRYPLRSTVRLRFMLPGERQEHKATARITCVTERPGGNLLLGLEFTEMSDLDRKRLNEYLDKTLCLV